MAEEAKWERDHGPSYPLSKSMSRYPDVEHSFDCDNNALMCIRCEEVTPLKACPNCKSTQYKAGIATDGTVGIFCTNCDKGFTRWTCTNCETENPVNTSMAKQKKGCFIATAVYGSPSSEEVAVLQSFRDEVLARSTLGRAFITGYYRFSPFYARLISQSETLKKVVRITAIRPLVRVAESFLKKN